MHQKRPTDTDADKKDSNIASLHAEDSVQEQSGPPAFIRSPSLDLALEKAEVLCLSCAALLNYTQILGENDASAAMVCQYVKLVHVARMHCAYICMALSRAYIVRAKSKKL